MLETIKKQAAEAAAELIEKAGLKAGDVVLYENDLPDNFK